MPEYAPRQAGGDSAHPTKGAHAGTTAEAGRGDPLPLHQRLTWGMDDLADLTGLSRRTLERERSAGRLPRPDLTVGRRVLWRPETIRRWIEGGRR